MLAAGALVASLLAVSSAPAGAAEIKAGDANEATPEVGADYSACVKPADASAGFTDTVGLGAEGAIDCLAYYGITTGKTADTFAPGENVKRSQMALFLSRAAKAAGVDLSGGKMAADFGDIADQGDDRQAAIQALARNGILMGRDDGFEPDEDITRAEMAVALIALLRKASGSLFNADGSLKNVTTLDHFADARAAVPRAVDTAISQAYELGITTGYPDATFRPNSPVPRKNMASFITRTLAHTNLRPAGVSMQRDVGADGNPTSSVRVSVRDADFKPVANARLDVFWATTANAGRAFNDNGTCGRLIRSNGGTKCAIDTTDKRTDGYGNRTTASIDFTKGATVWAWTGDVGDKVTADTDLYELAVEAAPASVAATSAKVTDSLPRGIAKAPFGSTVTVTIQLQGTSSGKTVDAGPAKGGASYSVLITLPDKSATRQTVAVDSSGKGTFDVTMNDPNAKVDNTDAEGTVKYAIERLTNARGSAAPAPASDERAGEVVFSDDARSAASMTADLGKGYAVASSKGVEVMVTVKVVDQYGGGVANTEVVLQDASVIDSDSAAEGTATFDSETTSTSSAGEADLFFTNKRSTPGVQKFDAIVPGTGTAARTAPAHRVDGDPGTAGVQPIWFRWVTEASTAGIGGLPVVAGDLAANEVVAGTGLIIFDSNDLFRIIGAGTTTLYGMEEFVKALGRDASINPLVAPADVKAATLNWASYDPDDPEKVTDFTLTLATPVAVPGAPGMLTLTAGIGEIDVAWTAPTVGSPATGYVVQYRACTLVADPTCATSTATWAQSWTTHTRTATDATSTTEKIGSLKNGTAYQVRVQASNSAGESAWSDSASATPMVRAGTPDSVRVETDVPSEATNRNRSRYRVRQ